MNYSSSKKAQTATEYLIILAVVIIIALIVISALGGIPSMGRTSKSRTTQSYWETQDIGVTSYSIKENDAVRLTLRNNLKYAVTVKNVTLGSSVMTTVDKVLAPGQSDLFTGTVTGSDACATAGNTYSHSLVIWYKDNMNNVQYSVSSTDQNLDGTCAI